MSWALSNGSCATSLHIHRKNASGIKTRTFQSWRRLFTNAYSPFLKLEHHFSEKIVFQGLFCCDLSQWNGGIWEFSTKDQLWWSCFRGHAVESLCCHFVILCTVRSYVPAEFQIRENTSLQKFKGHHCLVFDPWCFMWQCKLYNKSQCHSHDLWKSAIRNSQAKCIVCFGP